MKWAIFIKIKKKYRLETFKEVSKTKKKETIIRYKICIRTAIDPLKIGSMTQFFFDKLKIMAVLGYFFQILVLFTAKCTVARRIFHIWFPFRQTVDYCYHKVYRSPYWFQNAYVCDTEKQKNEKSAPNFGYCEFCVMKSHSSQLIVNSLR